MIYDKCVPVQQTEHTSIYPHSTATTAAATAATTPTATTTAAAAAITATTTAAPTPSHPPITAPTEEVEYVPGFLGDS